MPIEDVIIVGGGIVGCAAAHYLAKRGMGVTIFEKGEVAGEQSSRNWGFVRLQGRDPLELPLMIEGNRMWQTLEKELGQDLEWQQGGNLAIADNDEKMAAFEDWLKTAHQFGVDSRLAGKAEIGNLVPGMRIKWPGGLYTPGDGQAEPSKVTSAFARTAVANGAKLYLACAVDSIDVAGGKAVGVTTEQGSFRANTVVVAAGAWSSKLLRPLGIPFPQLLLRASVARTTRVSDITSMGVWTPDVAFRQRRDGTLNIASATGVDFDFTMEVLRYGRAFLPILKKNWRSLRPRIPPIVQLPARFGKPSPRPSLFRRVRVLDPKPNPKSIAAAAAGIREILPAMQPFSISRSWAGAIDVTPDIIPVLGSIMPGLVVASGFSGHGFGMGPIVGRLIAELSDRGHTSIDISAFSIDRFNRLPVRSRAVI